MHDPYPQDVWFAGGRHFDSPIITPTLEKRIGVETRGAPHSAALEEGIRKTKGLRIPYVSLFPDARSASPELVIA